MSVIQYNYNLMGKYSDKETSEESIVKNGLLEDCPFWNKVVCTSKDISFMFYQCD